MYVTQLTTIQLKGNISSAQSVLAHYPLASYSCITCAHCSRLLFIMSTYKAWMKFTLHLASKFMMDSFIRQCYFKILSIVHLCIIIITYFTIMSTCISLSSNFHHSFLCQNHVFLLIILNQIIYHVTKSYFFPSKRYGDIRTFVYSTWIRK